MATSKIVTVSIENAPGTLGKVARLLARENINIECIDSETIGEFGFVRLATDNPDLTEKLLRDEGYFVTTSEYVDAIIANRPGEVARICEALAEANINIGGLFCTTPEGADASVRVCVRVPDAAEAERVLQNAYGLARTISR